MVSRNDEFPQSRTGIALALFALLTSCTAGKDERAVLPPAKPAPGIDAPPEVVAVEKAPDQTNNNAIATSAAAPVIGTAVANEVAPPPAPDAAQSISARLTGEVDAPRKSLLAFRQTGFIAEILAKPGITLKKGDTLAILDDRDYKIRLDLAKARAEQAQVQVNAAGKDFEREGELQRENASTNAALDKIKLAFDSAKLALRLAELDVQVANFAFKDARLQAPYDCVVAQQLKQEGENLQAGNAVFEIYDTGEPEIHLAVPERMIGQVAIGSRLNVFIPSANYTGKAKITRLVRVISEKTRTFQIIAQLDTPNARIVPGSYAEATLN